MSMKTTTKFSGPVTSDSDSLFQKCRSIDCSDIVQTSYNGARYISWANAWQRLKENFPDASYKFILFDGLPYLKTEVGYFVKVEVTVESNSVTEILPVMDSKGNVVKECDARDVSDSIKRCMVKAIALHGLGLECYQKEDPHDNDYQKLSTNDKPIIPKQEFKAPTNTDKMTPQQFGKYNAEVNKLPGNRMAQFNAMVKGLGITDVKNMTKVQASGVIDWLVKTNGANTPPAPQAKKPIAEMDEPTPIGDDNIPF